MMLLRCAAAALLEPRCLAPLGSSGRSWNHGGFWAPSLAPYIVCGGAALAFSSCELQCGGDADSIEPRFVNPWRSSNIIPVCATQRRGDLRIPQQAFQWPSKLAQG